MLNTPVCVVGAGPAGATTSLFLSKHGVPHILTERAVFPREKVCGEFYDGRLRRVFDKIDPTLLQRLRDANVIHDIHRYSFYNTKLNELHIPSKPNARISTNRIKFDEFLLNEALKSPLATYIDDVNMHTVHVTGQGVVLQDREQKITINAQMAVLATGNNSSLPKAVVPANTSMGHFMLAARGYYSNLVTEQSINSTRNYIIKKPVRCYIFIAELPGNLSTVELFVLKSIATKCQVTPKDLLEELIVTHPALIPQFKHAALQGKIRGISVPYTSSKQRISGQRVLLAGSCGYNINPLTGLGVGHAVFTAMHAANQCAESLQTGDFSAKAISKYDELIYKALKFDNRLGKMADFGVKNLHGITDRLFNVIAASPALKKQLDNIINRL